MGIKFNVIFESSVFRYPHPRESRDIFLASDWLSGSARKETRRENSTVTSFSHFAARMAARTAARKRSRKETCIVGAGLKLALSILCIRVIGTCPFFFFRISYVYFLLLAERRLWSVFTMFRSWRFSFKFLDMLISFPIGWLTD